METILLTSKTHTYYWYKEVIDKLPLDTDFKIVIDLKNILPSIANINNFIVNITKIDERYQLKELHFLNIFPHKFTEFYKSLDYFFERKNTTKIIFNYWRNICLSIDDPHISVDKTLIELNSNKSLEKLNNFFIEENYVYCKKLRHDKLIKSCSGLFTEEKIKMLSNLKVLHSAPHQLIKNNEMYEGNYYLNVEGVIYDLHKVIKFINVQMPNCKILSIKNSVISIDEVKLLKKMNVLFIDIKTCTVNKKDKVYKNREKILKYKSTLYDFPKFILYDGDRNGEEIEIDVRLSSNIFSSLENYLLYLRN